MKTNMKVKKIEIIKNWLILKSVYNILVLLNFVNFYL